MTDSNGVVSISDRDGVRTITINRPDVRNAINAAVAEAIDEAVTGLDEDNRLIVGILTGAGGCFSSGMDLKAFLRGERPVTEGRGFAGLVEAPPTKPLIAAVEGYALAGGFELVLACDLIVASSGARFALPEVKRGLVAAGGGLLRLPQRIPYHVAMELGVTGRPMDATTAHSYGLVNRLAEPGTAVKVAEQMANEIAQNGPLAVAGTKRIVRESRMWSDSEAFDRQRDISEPLRASADAREGALAFIEKRAPQWRSK